MKLSAAFLVVGGVVLVFTGCGDDSDPSTATPSSQSVPAVEADEPEAVFDFAVDNLCDWFTADEMNQIIATAQEGAGTRWQLEEFETEDCLRQEPPVPWPGPFTWNTLGSNLETDSTVIDYGQPNLMVNMVPIAWTGLEPAEDFVGDEMLDASVTYGNPEHECGWDESMSFDLRVDGHEDEVLRFELARPNNLGAACNGELVEAEATSLAFGVADAMLTSMNWIE